MPTFTLNFSRAGNQVVGQYYNFLRLGRAGYTQVMNTLSNTALVLRPVEELQTLRRHLRRLQDPGWWRSRLSGVWLALPVAGATPVRCVRGFAVPTGAGARHTMPTGAEDISVLRVVVREGFSADLARSLGEDLHAVLDNLDAIRPEGHRKEHFAH